MEHCHMGVCCTHDTYCCWMCMFTSRCCTFLSVTLQSLPRLHSAEHAQPEMRHRSYFDDKPPASGSRATFSVTTAWQQLAECCDWQIVIATITANNIVVINKYTEFYILFFAEFDVPQTAGSVARILPIRALLVFCQYTSYLYYQSIILFYTPISQQRSQASVFLSANRNALCIRSPS